MPETSKLLQLVTAAVKASDSSKTNINFNLFPLFKSFGGRVIYTHDVTHTIFADMAALLPSGYVTKGIHFKVSACSMLEFEMYIK